MVVFFLLLCHVINIYIYLFISMCCVPGLEGHPAAWHLWIAVDTCDLVRGLNPRLMMWKDPSLTVKRNWSRPLDRKKSVVKNRWLFSEKYGTICFTVTALVFGVRGSSIMLPCLKGLPSWSAPSLNCTILVARFPDRTPSPRRPENYEGMMYQTSMKDEISTRTLCAMVKLIGLYIYI